MLDACIVLIGFKWIVKCCCHFNQNWKHKVKENEMDSIQKRTTF